VVEGRGLHSRRQGDSAGVIRRGLNDVRCTSSHHSRQTAKCAPKHYGAWVPACRQGARAGRRLFRDIS
jgi:hypothetical protein